MSVLCLPGVGQRQSKNLPTATMKRENYDSLSPPTTSPPPNLLTVHFYGHPMKGVPLHISLEDRDGDSSTSTALLTCEQVLVMCCEHLSTHLGRYFIGDGEKTIGPLLLPLFGLYAKDHKLQRWVSEAQVFDQNSAGQEYYFRIKVRLPVVDKSDRVPKGVFADYLFWQCQEDFLTGRVWQLYKTDNKIKDLNSINFNVVHMYMASASYRLHNSMTVNLAQLLTRPLEHITSLKLVRQKMGFCSMMKLFPEYMPPEVEKVYNLRHDFLLHMIAYQRLRRYVEELFEHVKNVPLKSLRAMIVSCFVKDHVPKYGLEFFPAERLRNDGQRPVPVELIVRPYQDGCQPGLYFNTKMVSRLQDILCVEITDTEDTAKCQVNIDFRNEAPKILHMPSRESAESFVSVLDTYYRLKVNYHSSLCPSGDLKPPTLRLLLMLRCYGPMQEEAARQHLRDRLQEIRRVTRQDLNPYYMIYQDTDRFGLLHVLISQAGTDNLTSSDIGFRQVATDESGVGSSRGSGFHLTVYGGSVDSGNVEKETEDPKELIKYLNTGGRQRIVPREDELCGAMTLLKEATVNYYSEVSDRPRGNTRAQAANEGPLVYREDQVKIVHDCPVVKGRFSEVVPIKLQDLERDAVLKTVTKDPAVQESYRRGMDKLVQLRDCTRFVKVYGLMITSPLRLILESVPMDKGSLLKCLKEKTLLFTWQKLSHVLVQLAECLDFLERNRLVYGNFCCRKILVMGEDGGNQTLTIRLGDPGAAIHLDSLPLTDKQNLDRLAWIAVERFKNLSHHSVASEVYAVATTLWEMAAHGRDPKSVIGDLPDYQVTYFSRGGRLPLDFLGGPEDPSNVVINGVVTIVGETSSPLVKVHQWMDKQNLEQQAREDSTQAPVYSHEGSGDSQGGSAPEYQIACTVDDSAPQYGAAAAEASGGATATDQGRAAPAEEPNAQLEEMKRVMRALMTAMWVRSPDQRPQPTEVMKQAVTIRKLSLQALKADPQWQKSQLLEHAVLTNNVRDPQLAERLKTELQSAFLVNHGSQPEPTKDYKKLERLEREVMDNMACSIEVSRLDFTNSKTLGKGQFGQVMTALLSEDCETREETENSRQNREKVAVKQLSSEENKADDVAQFLKEALCIYRLKHPNITMLKGIVMSGINNPYQLVMEYADQGSMETYVLENKSKLGTLVFKKTLRSIAVDVAKGMKYVHELDRVHGDLAARNILLFSNRNNRPPTAKLCDFGLSHMLNSGYYDLSKSDNASPKLPVWQLPPEMLQRFHSRDVKFTVYSDIWSYGVFLWEIFSGMKPELIVGNKTEIICTRLQSRSEFPFKKPDHCTQRMYEVMEKCWQGEKKNRPKFDHIICDLDDLTDQDLD